MLETPLLRLREVGKRYGGVQALRGVDLELFAGEVHCLVGENGSGKSTLIKIVSGVVRPDEGSVLAFQGKEIDQPSPALAKRWGVQVIYQDLSLFPNLTVAENIGFDRNLKGLFADKVGAREAAQAALDRIDVPLALDERVEQLPIAQRQLVAIARALAGDARLLIMDEPTASLTKAEVSHLLAVVRDLKQAGLCIVFVSHRLDEIKAIADRATVLRDGQKVGTYPVAELDEARISELMTGQRFAYGTKPPLPADRLVVLEVEGLTRAGDFHDVDLELRQGEILGITGLLGSGRTELALALFGMNRPDRGEVRLNGRKLRLTSNRDAIREGIAYVSEDRLGLGLVMRQSIASNLTLSVLRRLTGAFGLIDAKRYDAAVGHGVDAFRIKIGDPGDPVTSLSGGNQQRVVLSKWVATRPKVLILDSPTVGVDVSAKNAIYGIVDELATSGVAVILISDEVPEVYHHAHRVLVMRQGRLVGGFDPSRSDVHAIDRLVHA